MKVLNCAPGEDTGGDGHRTKVAFDRLSDIEYRFTRRSGNYLEYPGDLPWEEARTAWLRADVVHVREGFGAQAMLDAPDRPTVIHHHGTQFRRHSADLIREQRERGAIGLAATLDLWLMAPDDLTWLPAPYDLGALAAMRVPIDDGVLRIAHAPTKRAAKSTDAFLAAASRLGLETPVEVILIERTPWAQCLARKARADIYFDQVLTGYGNNAIEAWGMGIPVIAGIEPEAARLQGHLIPDGTPDEMERRWGGFPFVRADEGLIYEALRLLADPATRQAWADRGLAHVRTFHDEAVVVPMLHRIYESAR